MPGRAWYNRMERDCIIAHGASRFLKERLFDVSDPFQISVCKMCGVMTTTRNECQSCKKDSVVICNFPYASKLLENELSALALKMTFRASDK